MRYEVRGMRYVPLGSWHAKQVYPGTHVQSFEHACVTLTLPSSNEDSSDFFRGKFDILTIYSYYVRSTMVFLIRRHITWTNTTNLCNNNSIICELCCFLD